MRCDAHRKLRRPPQTSPRGQNVCAASSLGPPHRSAALSVPRCRVGAITSPNRRRLPALAPHRHPAIESCEPAADPRGPDQRDADVDAAARGLEPEAAERNCHDVIPLRFAPAIPAQCGEAMLFHGWRTGGGPARGVVARPGSIGLMRQAASRQQRITSGRSAGRTKFRASDLTCGVKR